MQTLILNYYPPIMQQIEEIQTITKAEEIEFSKLKEKTEGVIKNMFLFTATESGISKLETILGIKSKEEQSIEERRNYLYYSMNQRKMSLSELEKMFFNSGKIYLEPDYNAEEIRVWADTKTKNLKVIFEMLDNLLPLQIYIYFILEIIAYLEFIETNITLLLQSNNDFWKSWVLETGITLKADLKTKLSYKDTIVKKHRNLWHLDGNVKLNGSKRLNAESIEEAF